MRPQFVGPSKADEYADLTATFKTSKDVRWVHRCQAILLSADGWRIPQIAELLHVDDTTVHRWLYRFEADGLQGLVIEWGNGRPPAWDEAYESLLVETVRHDPRWYGLEQSIWTCNLLAGYLAQQTGITLSSERVCVLLHQHGIPLKQPTPVVPRHRGRCQHLRLDKHTGLVA